MSRASWAKGGWLALLAFGCATAAGAYPPREPVWRDPDRGPFSADLQPYYSPHDWDRLEKSFVLPALDVLAVRVGGEAANVNAWDEVPDSSWFENRIGRFALSADAPALDPCPSGTLDGSGPWKIVAAKSDGATPGFVFEAPDGQRYLAKFDGTSGSPRASLAEVLGAGLYHAAGYRVPCNSIVYFDAAILVLGGHARAENELGEKVPLTRAHIEMILSKALRLADGRYRCVASLYLKGKPLGPWRYHGLRQGDRNDVIPHEDRRELRASRLLAAWTDHIDQREGNTLAMWHETEPGRGYVMHHLLDFGDCFGSIWTTSAAATWRRGHDYWLDPRTVLFDWLTLGSVEQPWDRARLGSLGLVLGYYDVEQFDAEEWRPRYPNPAFSRMTEHDAAWMARILARLTPEHIERILERTLVPRTLHEALRAILLGRREKILRRYLQRLSPLADPEIRAQEQQHWLCATDLARQAGIAPVRRYVGRFWFLGRQAQMLTVRAAGGAVQCALLPAITGTAGSEPAYLVVELSPAATPAPTSAIRFHLYGWAAGRWQTVGIERLGA